MSYGFEDEEGGDEGMSESEDKEKFDVETYIAGRTDERKEWEKKVEEVRKAHFDFSAIISEFKHSIEFHKIKISQDFSSKETLLKQVEDRMNDLFQKRVNRIFKPSYSAEPAKLSEGLKLEERKKESE